MHETSKAARRRLRDPMFSTTYFRGKALDIGAGPDGLGKQIALWPLLESVDEWDVGDGDAQELRGVADDSYDLVISSHCLEHLHDSGHALRRWMSVVRPGGHLVATVPDWQMYERKQWPSRFNPDHKNYFPTIRYVADLLRDWEADVIKIERITEHFDPTLPSDYDQTQGLAECAIEFIVRKPE